MREITSICLTEESWDNLAVHSEEKLSDGITSRCLMAFVISQEDIPRVELTPLF